MKSGALRLVAVLAVLLMVFSPLQTAMAQDAPLASPVVEAGSGGDTGDDSSTNPEASPESSQPENGARTLAAPAGFSTLAVDSSAVTITSVTPVDNGDGTWDITVKVSLAEGLEIANGDVLGLTIYVNGQGTITSWSDISGPSSFGASWSSVYFWNAYMELTANNAFTVGTGGEMLSLSFTVTPNFNDCEIASPSTYSPTVKLKVYNGDFSSSQEAEIVAPVVCTGISDPTVSWMGYDVQLQQLNVQMLIPVPMIPGQSLTISYDNYLFAGPSSPVPVRMHNYATGTNDIVGNFTVEGDALKFVVTASGNAGDYSGYTNDVLIPMLLIAHCEPGDLTSDVGEYIFEASSGYEAPGFVDVILCEADPISKTGSWETDESGEPYIEWVIDSGDLLPTAEVSDSVWTWDRTFEFDCDLEFDIAPADGTTVRDSECYQGYWYVELVPSDENGTETVRAVITVAARPLEWGDSTSFVNCAESNTWREQSKFFAASSATGIGGQSCFELFRSGEVGDAITKTVDKEIAQPGDTITYTVEVATSSNTWDSIDLSDELPSGFEIDPSSITCSVEPSDFVSDPCYVLDGNVLKVSAVPALVEMEGEKYPETGAVTITVTFSGKVTAPAGSTITNEACSVRNVSRPIRPGLAAATAGDPSIVGGGTICDDAVTKILGVAVPKITFTEATCTDDAKVAVEPVDGVTYSTVTEIGAGKTVIINASIDLTTHKWGDLTGTDWKPKDGDPSTVVATHTFKAKPDCVTPTATIAPTETPSPTATTAPTGTPVGTPTTPDPVTPTATTAVTGLPSTGTSGGTGNGWQLLTAALVATVMVAGLGIRASANRK